jgi:undecaprenyl diphosphate synthase
MTQLNHIAFIMDGNRRWAKANGKSAGSGHLEGYRTMKKILQATREHGIKYASVYAFSTENWKRSKEEVDAILGLARRFAKNELKDIVKEGVRVIWLGSEDNVPEDIVKMIRDAEEKTKDYSGHTLAICFNYGGKHEIVQAAQAVVDSGGELTEDAISNNLYGPEVPPIDLLIRTSGECRLSNFMLWRADYAELAFTDTLWPDFSTDELAEIIDDYLGRSRRFGA